ncbi:MAG TPA: DinB family protein [Terriglobales bacterium]|nr:DinB family protein [Terriglobales bacterium]
MHKTFRLSCLLSIVLLLATCAQAQTAPAASALTHGEREGALKHLEHTRDMFLQSISGLTEKQWNFKPAPDRWSIAQVAEHITISEGTLLGLVRNRIVAGPATPEKRAEVKGKDELVLTKIPDRSRKAQAPEFLKPTGRWPTQAALTAEYQKDREATMDYVRTTNDDLRDHFFDHPAMGTLDGYQWLLLISAHSERHTEQINEVKADPNFPKE